VYDSVQEMLTKQNETITDDINNVSGTNIAELAVKLMEAQTIYNMALSMGSRILPPSLADYL
jgi:flagellar hook-associated protein 3 FlgL